MPFGRALLGEDRLARDSILGEVNTPGRHSNKAHCASAAIVQGREEGLPPDEAQLPGLLQARAWGPGTAELAGVMESSILYA